MAFENGETEAFIIGGGKIYEQTAELWDKLYLTEVDLEIEGDVHFPEINLDEWNLISENPQTPDEKNEYNYNFKILERKL
jgi:dihydrofolate reductase